MAKKATLVDHGAAKGKKKAESKASKKNANKRLVVATNRRARHDYTILDTWEAGIQLVGTEVKSLREGKASLIDSFATIDDGEVWLRHLHIPEYSKGHWTNHSPRRTRKLLLHRNEIDSIMGKVRDGNNTLIPLSLYFSDGKLKVELALGRGKQDYDRRQDIKRRTEEREATRALGRRVKGLTG